MASLTSLLKALVNRATDGAGDEYLYSPLSDHGNIRLLRLMPHQDKEAPLQCELFEYPLRKARQGVHLYETLSYVWGSEENPKPISIWTKGKNHRLLVTANLHAALLHLRDGFFERILWIDAICINQKDHAEKGQQVQFMAEIYANASCVIVWLGEATSDSGQAFEALRKAGREGTEYTMDEPTEQAIFALLERPWFQRIWVVQEAAAARRVLMKCGPDEVDGFAFCSGIAALKLSYTTHPHLRSLVPPITYLIRDASFRPRGGTGQPETSQPESSLPNTFSLNIRPLGELVDMYHVRKATNRLDKVYALLGMSTDDPRTAGLSADYNLPWEGVFRRLIEFLLPDQVSVDVWEERAVAVIQGKGFICGLVSAVEDDDTRGDVHVQRITITWKNGLGHWRTWQSNKYILPASANPICQGDAVCLLQGATKPTIARFQDAYAIIIMITAPLEEPDQKWSELLQSIPAFPTEFVMIWDWDVPQHESWGQDYESLITSRGGPQRPWTESQDYFVKAIRLWNFGLLLSGIEGCADSKVYLQDAVEAYATALRKADTSPGYGAWAEADEQALMAMDDLVIRDGDHPVETECFNDHTPVFWAVEKGREGLVKLLLDKGAVIDVETSTGQTPLSRAAEKGHDGIVKLLLSKGATIGAAAGTSKMTLSWAAEQGYESIVKLLFDEGTNLDDKDSEYMHDYMGALEAASFKGYTNIVRMLLEAPDKARRGWDYGTAFHRASWGNYDQVRRMLIKRGADLDSGTYYAKALSAAAAEGHDEIVQILLDRGVDPNPESYHLGNPLQAASAGGHEKIVRMLLENGADVNSRGTDHKALWSAATRGHDKIVQILLENGADVNAQDRFFENSLHAACAHGHKKIVQILLDNGADMIAKGDDHGDALQTASFFGHDEIVQILLDNGADVNARGGKHHNALQAASFGGHEKIVQILLEKGADVNAQGDRGWLSALHAARARGHENVIRILLEKGAEWPKL
ncbi:ankyrin repeat-containing domain protein [Chaetomium sp. MPI-CAGE-AT-0009]|nr:ankyrin repeat-containing domain protein [Chaetomium sp. MPI-CAGE-AT-0009]